MMEVIFKRIQKEITDYKKQQRKRQTLRQGKQMDNRGETGLDDAKDKKRERGWLLPRLQRGRLF